MGIAESGMVDIRMENDGTLVITPLPNLGLGTAAEDLDQKVGSHGPPPAQVPPKHRPTEAP
jgi:hypothetical protein